MLTLYRLVLYLGLPYFIFKLVLRGLQNKQYFDRLRQRFGFLSIRPKPRGIWVHAVSMGEVNAAAPLINVLMEKYPDDAFTVTTMTPTGSERVTRLFGDRVHHCYLPYDLPGAVSRFVRRVQPRLGIVMETEIWPNFIHKCHQKKIPLIYANVRMSRKSHRGYQRFLPLVSKTLQKVDLFAVQAKTDAKRMIRLGAHPKSVHVTGSIKFDITTPASIIEAAQAIRRKPGLGKTCMGCWQHP